ncbi:unnamed protein product [Discosporangium mesarthrocarpum]
MDATKDASSFWTSFGIPAHWAIAGHAQAGGYRVAFGNRGSVGKGAAPPSWIEEVWKGMRFARPGPLAWLGCANICRRVKMDAEGLLQGVVWSLLAGNRAVELSLETPEGSAGNLHSSGGSTTGARALATRPATAVTLVGKGTAPTMNCFSIKGVDGLTSGDRWGDGAPPNSTKTRQPVLMSSGGGGGRMSGSRQSTPGRDVGGTEGGQLAVACHVEGLCKGAEGRLVAASLLPCPVPQEADNEETVQTVVAIERSHSEGATLGWFRDEKDPNVCPAALSGKESWEGERAELLSRVCELEEEVARLQAKLEERGKDDSHSGAR